jgi:phosphate acetyltransferase
MTSQHGHDRMADRKDEKYEALIKRAAALSPLPTIVLHPCDETSLRSAGEAPEADIISPILVGPAECVRKVASDCRLEISAFER